MIADHFLSQVPVLSLGTGCGREWASLLKGKNKDAMALWVGIANGNLQYHQMDSHFPLQDIWGVLVQYRKLVDVATKKSATAQVMLTEGTFKTKQTLPQPLVS